MPSGRAIRAGRAFVELFADNTKLVRGLRAARAKVRAFGQRLQNIGMRIATTTAAMALPIAIATRTFAGFEDQMAQVRAVTTHVKAGDRLEIRAPVWNKMLDAARDRQAQQHNTGRTPGPDFRGVPVLIKNSSGADRSQYEILGVSGVVFAATDDGFKQRIVLTGVTPATDSHEGKFAVLAEPIGDEDIGPAVDAPNEALREYERFVRTRMPKTHEE
jgi:hypothetical protein